MAKRLEQWVIEKILQELSNKQIDIIKYEELIFKKDEEGKKVEIARGGFGIVYQGYYRHSEVAIKQIKQGESKQDSDKALDGYIKEIKLHQNLIKQEKILNLIGICYDYDELYIITPYQKGGSLYDAIYIQKKFSNLDPEAQRNLKLDYMIEIAEGIVSLHTQNPPIIHRDLKPQNILLDQHGSIKIADLGIATQSRLESQNQATVTNLALGSYRYMTPEQFDAEFQKISKISTKADI